MNGAEEIYESKFRDRVEAACHRIAPLWPLKNFVAVNPYWGHTTQSFWQAHETLARITGTGLCMPRAYYREQIARGRITRTDLATALQKFGRKWTVSTFEHLLARETSSPPTTAFPLVTDVLSELDGRDWSTVIVERISRLCAAYFDEGQAQWSLPWRNTSLYNAWLSFTRVDQSLWMLGVRGLHHAMETCPQSAPAAIAWALHVLEVPSEAIDDYLHATLLSVGGWAAWTRYQRWQKELAGNHDDSIRDLVAIRLAWDALLYILRSSIKLQTAWHQSLIDNSKSTHRANREDSVDVVLQTAFEIGYQRRLAQSLTVRPYVAPPIRRAKLHAVFCIDVRSEIYRRALESAAPGVQTQGFAGFFGIPMEYLPFGAVKAQGHLPVLFNASYRIAEGLDGAMRRKSESLVMHRRSRIRVAKAWKTFKSSAASCFGFVEAVGLFALPKLLSDSLGWTRPLPNPQHAGLSTTVQKHLGPLLDSKQTGLHGEPTGIPEAERLSVAELVLRNMGMVQDFARLVLFVGHGSRTVNNPQATGLDCGACAGQSGEASARIAVALLNDPHTRSKLARHGIQIPVDTHFIAGLHDTTTDEVRLFNVDDAPPSHQSELAQLAKQLATAGQIARLERAHLLGISKGSPQTIHSDVRRRARDWAEVRPEWALAGNAAFIAAPRPRTAHCNLAGRAFLHEYHWHQDPQFDTLQLIMTGPMIVAHWINMQYYGSTVDPRRFGSGNKVLHNVVGGSIGVLEGNGGDLRSGLAWQSLHDGERWMHEPLRLNVLIEAPQSALDDIIGRHVQVRDLVDHEWVHLFQIDQDGHLHRRDPDKHWVRDQGLY